MKVVIVDQQPRRPTYHRHGNVAERGGVPTFVTRCGAWWAQWRDGHLVHHSEALNIDRRLAERIGKPCRRCFPLMSAVLNDET